MSGLQLAEFETGESKPGEPSVRKWDPGTDGTIPITDAPGLSKRDVQRVGVAREFHRS